MALYPKLESFYPKPDAPNPKPYNPPKPYIPGVWPVPRASPETLKLWGFAVGSDPGQHRTASRLGQLNLLWGEPNLKARYMRRLQPLATQRG